MIQDPIFQNAVNPGERKKAEARVRLDDTDNERLLVRYKVYGDRLAYDNLIEGNQRLVMSHALQYRQLVPATEQLVEAGNKGLVRAIENFDPVLQRGFSVTAERFIRDSLEALFDQRRKGM